VRREPSAFVKRGAGRGYQRTSRNLQSRQRQTAFASINPAVAGFIPNAHSFSLSANVFEPHSGCFDWQACHHAQLNDSQTANPAQGCPPAEHGRLIVTHD